MLEISGLTYFSNIFLLNITVVLPFNFLSFLFFFFLITEHTLIFNSAPLMIIFVGLKIQVGHIQIILSDHVSLKIRNYIINSIFP